MYAKFEAEIEKLNQRVEEQACKRAGARLLMTYPGVGPVTALVSGNIQEFGLLNIAWPDTTLCRRACQ